MSRNRAAFAFVVYFVGIYGLDFAAGGLLFHVCFETPDSCFVVVSGPRYIYTLDIAHSLFVGGSVWCMVCGVLLVACGCVGGGVCHAGVCVV